MNKNGTKGDRQKGPAPAGWHGSKTVHAKAMEERQAQGYTSASPEAVRERHQEAREETPPWGHHDEVDIRRHDTPGKDRLFEKRVQHDYADLESDKTRRARDEQRHGHPRVTPARRSGHSERTTL